MNIITNNTAYLTFDQYDQSTGLLSNTWDIPKKNISSIHTYYKEMTEDRLGIVVLSTIMIVEPNAKNALLQLNPIAWALSTSPTVAFSDALSLKNQLLSFTSIFSVSDNFNSYSVGPLAGQGNWITIHNAMAVVDLGGGNKVIKPNTLDEIGVGRSETFTSNQSSQITLTTTSPYAFIGPSVRTQTTSGGEYYGYYVSDTERYVFYVINGLYYDLGHISGTSNIAGDVFKITVVGNTITCYKNGVVDSALSGGGIYTDTHIPSGGTPGVTGYGIVNAYGDSWIGSNI